MNRLFCAVAIALITAVFVACGGDDEAGESGDTALPTAAKTTAATSPAAAGEDALPAGTHTTGSFGVPVTLTVGEGWKRPVDNADFFVLEHPPADDGPFGFIGFHLPTQTYNPSEATLELGPPPADFVEWLTSHRLLNIVDTQPVTLGGIDGTQFEITTDTFADFPLFELSDDETFELRFKDHLRIDVLDVAGSQLLVKNGSDLPANFDNFEPLAQDVLATVEFAE